MEDLRNKSRNIYQRLRRSNILTITPSYKHRINAISEYYFTENQQLKRSSVINCKRIHLSEVELELHDNFSDSEIASLIHSIKSNKDISTLRKLKHVFSQNEKTHQIFIKSSGALQGLIGLLTGREITLQIEAAACFINLFTSKDHKLIIAIAKLTVPYFVLYLQSSSTNLQELSTWALGNVASDCDECCKLLKTHNFCQSIFTLLERTKSSEVIYNSLFALKCYMSHTSTEWSEILSMGLSDILPNYLKSPDNEQIFVESTNILFYLSTKIENENYILMSGCLESVILHFNEMSSLIKDNKIYLNKVQCQMATFMIRCLAGICENTHISTEIIFQINLLLLALLLKCNYLHVHKETLWLLNNLSCHSKMESSPLHESIIIINVAEKLLNVDEIVHQGLIFFCNLLSIHGWNTTLSPISTIINEATMMRLLFSSNHVTVSLTLKLLNLIYGNKDYTNPNYSDRLTSVMHDRATVI